jgi:glycosyltransferase involved in cell wall biosynthesis
MTRVVPHAQHGYCAAHRALGCFECSYAVVKADAQNEALPLLRILVVVPTHDRAEFLEEALDSLDKQTRKADRVVVIGNVGPRREHEGIEYQPSDAGLQDRLNTVVAESNCDAHILLCDDDMLGPTFIERTVRKMVESKADIVYTDYLIFGDRNVREYSHIVPITNLCTREMWERAGRYAAVPYFDWDFWWCCADAGLKAVPIHELLWRYRSHPGQDGWQETDEIRARNGAVVVARHTTKTPYYK